MPSEQMVEKAREWLKSYSYFGINNILLPGSLEGSLAALLEETAALNEVAQDMCDRVDAVMRGERRPGEALDECAARLIRERDEALERETLNRQAAEKWYESSESYRTLRDEARAEERERAKRIVGECEVAACNECEGDCARETCGEILRRLEDEHDALVEAPVKREVNVNSIGYDVLFLSASLRERRIDAIREVLAEVDRLREDSQNDYKALWEAEEARAEKAEAEVERSHKAILALTGEVERLRAVQGRVLNLLTHVEDAGDWEAVRLARISLRGGE